VDKTLLYVQQEKWHKAQLIQYGNTVTLMRKATSKRKAIDSKNEIVMLSPFLN